MSEREIGQRIAAELQEMNPTMSGQKIIDGLRDAIAGNFSAVTIEGQRWVRVDAQSARTPEIEDDLIKAITNELMAHGEFSTIQANNRPNAEVAARAVLGIVDRCFSREPNNADRQQTPDAWLVGWFRANGDSGTKAYVSEDDARSAAVNLEKYSSSETTASVLPLYASPIPEGDRGGVLETLNTIAPAVENLARHQEQCDMDGVMVKVSRQALDEVLNAINGLALDLSQLPSTNRGSAA